MSCAPGKIAWRGAVSPASSRRLLQGHEAPTSAAGAQLCTALSKYLPISLARGAARSGRKRTARCRHDQCLSIVLPVFSFRSHSTISASKKPPVAISMTSVSRGSCACVLGCEPLPAPGSQSGTRQVMERFRTSILHLPQQLRNCMRPCDMLPCPLLLSAGLHSTTVGTRSVGGECPSLHRFSTHR